MPIKKIYAISGSAGVPSSNRKLLESLAHHYKKYCEWHLDDCLTKLPLYQPSLEERPLSEHVVNWRKGCNHADAIIICTPEYLHNIPAVLKNGMEWLKSSGEWMNKRVLPITFTPHHPRGEHAMPSLRNSLIALKANPVVELNLYKSDFQEENGLYAFNEDQCMVFDTALELLGV
ncbi:MAG: NAD(P)H-dependent oxidoreductase [Cryomorphaceae bacterium]|nr:MAG: NAD(P)H-dependent oxidoreductase [Cryomorphaceae bacterium]